MTQSQSYTDNEERQPLLTTNAQPTMGNNIEFDQQIPTTLFTTNDQHDDGDTEARWFAELQQKPWYNRPSPYWLMPWLVVVGIMLSISSNSIEQLKIKTVCAQMLGLEDGGAIPGNFTSAIGDVRAFDSVDPCRSKKVLGFVGQLDGNIGAVNGIFTLLTLAKWTSLSDVLGRKFLLHIGMFGITVSFLLNWFAASRFNFFGYHIYYVEAVLLGLIPVGALLNPAVFSYTVDCTTGNNRSRTIGYLSTSFALGNIVGSAMGGAINKATGDLTVVVKISLVCTALLAIYLSALPESLKTKPASLTQWMASQAGGDHQTSRATISTQAKEATVFVQTLKRVFYLAKANLSTIFDPLLLFVPGHVPKSEKMATRYTPALIVLANFFLLIGVAGAAKLFIPMTTLVFKWRAQEDDFYSSFKSSCDFITYLAIFPALQVLYKRVVSSFQKCDDEEAAVQPLMQDSDEAQESSPKSTESDLSSMGAIKMDLVFVVGGLALLVFAHLLVPLIATEFILYFSRALSSLGQTAGVASISLVSSVMPTHMTGAVIGALSVADSLGNIIAVFSYGRLFKNTVDTSPMFYYYVSAGLCALALAFATVNWWMYRRK
ncbi:hypothetical protein K457DRAFT_121386 [Linnemannia elongata AG-77]|uniref:MFS general substrate transporter n=1 Tax=Linnemannia elongata AG-77 TaxID=1314771 RepID=A0A197KBC4_9FUNG|nr:hypothetical protein K457DRAFT_121386 [Linnemannia elongata AG-77]